MKRLDKILNEIADQLIDNTDFGGVGKTTYYRHPFPLVISKISMIHGSKKNRKKELVKELKSCWMSESVFKERYKDDWGRPVIERWHGRGVYRGVQRYLKTYRKRIEFLNEVGYDINIKRPDELPKNVKVYLDFGCNITEDRVGIHCLNPTPEDVRYALAEAELSGIEAVYIYEDTNLRFSGKRISRKGLAFNGTFRLQYTDLDQK